MVRVRPAGFFYFQNPLGMKLLIQRVNQAEVKVEGITVGKISKGLLVFVGFCKQDNLKILDKVVRKLINLRIFHDNQGKMNYSLADIKGELLIVSQFTLCGVIKSGTRPSFSNALEPEKARLLYEEFVKKCEMFIPRVQTGKFGAYMTIHLINDGPVTFQLEF